MWNNVRILSHLEVVRSTLDAGKAGQCAHIPSPLMYEWHGTQYLGAAHGLAGILTVLLQVEWNAAACVGMGVGGESWCWCGFECGHV